MIYDVNGNELSSISLDYDLTVKSVNHRGYNTVAPENTLPAYKLSKERGFYFVETDISFTSDNVAVLLHDSTIDRTSNGSGSISSMTFEQVRQYDFGSWKSSKYEGTLIPSLAEFLQLCKDIMLYPYLELKDNGGYTQAQIESIVDMVNQYGLRGKVTYISFSSTYLGYVHNYDSSARLGLLSSTASTSHITTLQGLKSTDNEVYYGTKYSTLTSAICQSFANAKIPIEIWTVNNASDVLDANEYVSGITSDSLIAGKLLYENAMQEE